MESVRVNASYNQLQRDCKANLLAAISSRAWR